MPHGQIEVQLGPVPIVLFGGLLLAPELGMLLVSFSEQVLQRVTFMFYATVFLFLIVNSMVPQQRHSRWRLRWSQVTQSTSPQVRVRMGTTPSIPPDSTLRLHPHYDRISPVKGVAMKVQKAFYSSCLNSHISRGSSSGSNRVAVNAGIPLLAATVSCNELLGDRVGWKAIFKA